MKTNRYIIAAGALLALSGAVLSSCNDFLTEDPKGRLVTENFFETENDLTLAVNALYYNVQAGQRHTNPFIVDCQGSDITSVTGSNKGPYLSADAYEDPSDFKGVNDLWSMTYNIIQAANLIIDNADKCKASAQDINIGKGNAYFWRAYAYFRLVRVFGPLPVNLHNTPDNNSTPMTSVEGVYNNILSDLENAGKCNLPATYSGLRKDGLGFVGEMSTWVTDQALKALQMAVYMNLAGYPLHKTEYWEKAADKGLEIYTGVKNGTYPNQLLPNWNQVYSIADNFASEMLVGVSYYDSPGMMGSSGVYTSQFPLSHRFSQFNGGWGDFIGERHFWADFPEGPRKRAVYDPQIRLYGVSTSDGSPLCVSWWATKDEQPYDADKKNAYVQVYHPMFSPFSINADADGNAIIAPYDYSKTTTTFQSYPQTHRVIRLAEVYCWFAEAAGRSGKHTSEATAALTEVMARAYDNPAPITDLAEQGYLEHGYEVAGYPLALCSKRSDEFRTERLEANWEYRNGPQLKVIVPKGTITHSYKEEKYFEEGNPRPKYRNIPYTYELGYDLVMPENMQVAPSWNGENSIYQVYPPTEVEKNPNIKR